MADVGHLISGDASHAAGQPGSMSKWVQAHQGDANWRPYPGAAPDAKFSKKVVTPTATTTAKFPGTGTPPAFPGTGTPPAFPGK